MNLTQQAAKMLRQMPEYRGNAEEKQGDQTVIGCVLALRYDVPRWAAERAVLLALAQMKERQS